MSQSERKNQKNKRPSISGISLSEANENESESKQSSDNAAADDKKEVIIKEEKDSESYVVVSFAPEVPQIADPKGTNWNTKNAGSTPHNPSARPFTPGIKHFETKNGPVGYTFYEFERDRDEEATSRISMNHRDDPNPSPSPERQYSSHSKTDMYICMYVCMYTSTALHRIYRFICVFT